MADSPSRKRAWRNAAVPAPASPPVEAPWRSPQGPPRQGLPWWKSRRVQFGFVAAAVLGVTVTLIVVALMWKPLQPFSFVAVYADYSNNLFVPPNIGGRNAADELIRLAEERKWSPQAPSKMTLDSRFEDIVKELVQKAPTKVVLFLTAHGVARYQNGGLVPYLVPQDADLRTETTPYPLDRLLDALAELPEKTPKLLLLDVTGIDAHWPLGELHNDFARALESRAGRIKQIKNLVVISSSDKDQRSWTSPEWGQTYFAHFVLEGLKGAADQKSEKGDSNGRVDALELFHYVQNHVKRWVWQNRERLQAPVMFGGDDDQRAKSVELVTCGDYEADNSVPDASEEKIKQDYKDLQIAWQQCKDLRRAMPHPAAYAPQLWRRYLDVLLRAEQLWISGDADAAKKMLRGLDDLQQSIVRSRSVQPELKSVPLTLAMPDALGLPRDGLEIRPTEIADLWKLDAAKKGDKDKAIAALEKLVSKERQRRQRSHAVLTDALFRKVADDPKQGLDRGRWLLEFIDPEAPSCRSAEAHYLMMLADNPMMWRSQGEANWPLVQQSLRLRRLGEQAALGLSEDNAAVRLPAYSEQVLPWIRSTIEKADEGRRLGQDLLFASSAAEWDKANKLFNEEVGPGYAKSQEIAVKIRRALDVRDRLYAELPYYTHWIAERGSEHEANAIELWNELHKLRRLLEKPVPGDAALAAQLDQQQQRLAESFKQIKNRLEESANQGSPNAQNRWHEIEAALAVPFLEPETRLNLIRDSRRISRDLFVQAPKAGNAEVPSTEGGRTSAQASALRQGRLALAMLAQDDWPDEYATVKNALDNPEEGAWYNSAVRAGQSIGQFLNQLPEMADKLCEEAARKDNLKDAAPLLESAARHTRTIEGAALIRMTRNPLEEKRRLGWHDLLCWQAHRTFLDWWAELGQNPQTRPYFRRAGEIFLADAEQMVMGKSAQANPAKPNPRLRQVEAEREQLRRSPEIAVKVASSPAGEFQPGPARLYLTDEPAGQERYYRLYGPDAREVPGAPVMWVEVQPKGQSGLQIIEDNADRKKVQFGPPTAYPLKIAADRRTERRGAESPRHVVHGFFRGHHPSLTTEVRMYREADQTLSLPLRYGGGNVAVQTKQSLYDLFGAEKTALSIVLDCSGSMDYPRPKPGPRRFDKAVEALKSALQDLPKGVMVSLRAFGAEESDVYRDKGGMKLVWEPQPWDPDKIDRQISKVKSLTPAYATPLLRSIRLASKDFPEVPLQSRTIVVITDGGDSNFYVEDRDQDLKEKSGARTIADYLKYLKKELDQAGIQLIVIGFDVKEGQMPSEEEEKSSKEFRATMKKLWGTYHDAEFDKDNLAAILRRSLLRLYFRVDPEFDSSVADLGIPGGPISQSDLREVPHYVPRERGHYLVRVPSTRKLEQLIGIGSGDAMLLDLVRNPESGDPAFRRCLFAKSHLAVLHGQERVPKAEPVDDWLLAVWQNHQSREAFSLQMLATLEKDDGIAQGRELLQQVRPEWCWFEVPAADGKSAAPPLHVHRVSNYPAPAWGLEVPSWKPWGASVTLKAWWRAKLPKPSGTLVKGTDFQSPFEPKLAGYNWPVDVPPGAVLLEGIDIERHRLPVVEGGGEKEVDCLTVRLRYPADTGPFFVHWPGWDGGQQHRFYTEAGKHTAIFWSEGKSMKEIAEKELKLLQLYSVGHLKDGASRVEGLKVGAPNDVWERPTPAPPVRRSRR